MANIAKQEGKASLDGLGESEGFLQEKAEVLKDIPMRYILAMTCGMGG